MIGGDNLTLQEIIPHFSNAKQTGSNQYAVNCPACGDTKGHLYISESAGKILLDCKKGCSFADIVQASGLNKADFFPPKPQKTARTKLREHIYTDTEGRALARKTIYDKGNGSKTAVWERFENGTYIKGLNGLKVPPYHVHNLKEGKTVVIAEGEKDVETLERMGFRASCSPNGAGGRTSWVKGHNEYFRGKSVIVLTDNDEPGKEHGRSTADSLCGVAESVRLIGSETIYPGLKQKGDISDIVQAVGIDEAKKMLIDAVKVAELYVKTGIAVKEHETLSNWDSDGTGELTIANLTAYMKAKGIEVQYNVITHNMEISGFSGESSDHIKETAPALIYDELHFSLKKCTMEKIGQFINVIATRNKYNPILEKINNTHWDGTDRLDEIYNIFCIDESDKLSRTIIKKWLMQCICGLHNNMENPFSLDIVLIFQGAQGIGKTRFLEKLALYPLCFGEGRTYDPRNKDSQIECTSKWICELGEIGSTMRKDIDSLKAFLTSSTDEYRLPYGKTALRYARMTSFCGTTNDRQFLIDETGNRRFATVTIPERTVIDYDTQVKPFDSLQLWAQISETVEALIAVNNSSYAACFRLTREELDELNRRNSEHLKPLKGELEVIDILEQQSREESGYSVEQRYMTVTEFIENNSALKRYKTQEISKVLDKLGYPMLKKRVEGRSSPSRVRLLPYRRYVNFNQKYY